MNEQYTQGFSLNKAHLKELLIAFDGKQLKQNGNEQFKNGVVTLYLVV